MFQILVGTKYKFMEARKITYLISLFLVLGSLGLLVAQGGPNESIDFTGGSMLYVEFQEPVDVAVIRKAAADAGLEGAQVQMAEAGREAFINFRMPEGDGSDLQNPYDLFRAEIEPVIGEGVIGFRSQEKVSPKIGKELEKKAALAILWSLVLILAYIAWRFTRVSFGIGAVIALFHDIVITLGILSLMGVEVSLTVVAAFLTIGGYSINDTIVVFDRIRENLGLSRRMSFKDIINRSINQTLSRTILTTATTLLAVGSLFVLGGVVIHDFALAMLIGVVIGTYSSIFVASALALDISEWWRARRAARNPGKAAKTGSKSISKAKTKAAAAQ